MPPRFVEVDGATYAATVRALEPYEGGGYIARAIELPGCVATGETEIESLEELKDAIRSWIRTTIEFGNSAITPSRKHH